MTSRGAERIVPTAYSVRHSERSCLALALTRQTGRNWGGRCFNALITTVAERRQQFHQTNIGEDVTAASQHSRRMLRVLLGIGKTAKRYTGRIRRRLVAGSSGNPSVSSEIPQYSMGSKLCFTGECSQAVAESVAPEC